MKFSWELIATQRPYLAQLDSPVWVLWHLLPSLLLHGHLALLHDVKGHLERLLTVVDASRLGEKLIQNFAQKGIKADIN